MRSVPIIREIKVCFASYPTLRIWRPWRARGTICGVYHILHGTLAPLKGIGPDEIRIAELTERLRAGEVDELIIATGFDVEGEATAAYLLRVLKSFDVKVTRLASGVPVGSFIEYMDPSTLDRAMEARKEVL